MPGVELKCSSSSTSSEIDTPCSLAIFGVFVCGTAPSFHGVVDRTFC